MEGEIREPITIDLTDTVTDPAIVRSEISACSAALPASEAHQRAFVFGRRSVQRLNDENRNNTDRSNAAIDTIDLTSERTNYFGNTRHPNLAEQTIERPITQSSRSDESITGDWVDIDTDNGTDSTNEYSRIRSMRAAFVRERRGPESDCITDRASPAIDFIDLTSDHPHCDSGHPNPTEPTIARPTLRSSYRDVPNTIHWTSDVRLPSTGQPREQRCSVPTLATRSILDINLARSPLLSRRPIGRAPAAGRSEMNPVHQYLYNRMMVSGEVRRLHAVAPQRRRSNTMERRINLSRRSLRYGNSESDIALRQALRSYQNLRSTLAELRQWSTSVTRSAENMNYSSTRPSSMLSEFLVPDYIESNDFLTVVRNMHRLNERISIRNRESIERNTSIHEYERRVKRREEHTDPRRRSKRVRFEKADAKSKPNISKASENDRADDEEAEKCVICLCEFEPKVNVRRLPCLHFFHTECADPWLIKSGKCPVCRVDIRTQPASRSSQGGTSRG